VQGRSLQSLLKEYLEASTKEQYQQTDEEKHSILKMRRYAEQLRRDLLLDEMTMFDGCQFLFCLPLGWACSKYMDGLRTLFIEAKWITQDDPKNRLIFSSFIESLFQYLVAHKDMNLGREKKYLLLSIDKVAIHLSSAQMQSAKELIAVSKKLAASDFLLVPTDLGDAVSMDLTALDKSVYNSVKEIIIKHILSIIRGKRYYKRSIFRFKNGNKKTTQKERHNMNATTQPLFSVISLHQIIEEIIDTLYHAFIAVSILNAFNSANYISTKCRMIRTGANLYIQHCMAWKDPKKFSED